MLVEHESDPPDEPHGWRLAPMDDDDDDDGNAMYVRVVDPGNGRPLRREIALD